MGQAIALSNWI